jgi:ABC-type sugar transport system ATPase subunit
MTNEQIESFINHKLSEIMEVCDTCQIVVTIQNNADDTTVSLSTGSGNLYARIGSVQEWINRQDEYNRFNARQSAQE